MIRERSMEPIGSGDPDVDQLAELVASRTAGECTKRQSERLADLQVDMAKRGIVGSGVEQRGKVNIGVAYIEEYCEQMMRELLTMVQTTYGAVTHKGADWIKRKLDRDLDLLRTGQAGCYVTSPEGQRNLADYVQRKKAGLSAALEIEVRTAALDARGPQGAAAASNGPVGPTARD